VNVVEGTRRRQAGGGEIWIEKGKRVKKGFVHVYREERNDISHEKKKVERVSRKSRRRKRADEEVRVNRSEHGCHTRGPTTRGERVPERPG